MKTAVNYLRYSSDSQTEQSIEGQMRVCQDYANSHDILILDTYIDRAMTGTNDNRPDFQRMIKDSARREWDYVLVYKLDRFSRNKYEMAMHKKTLKDNGVKVISAMEYIPDTPEAIIFESMLEGYAEYYSAELSQKVRRGMNETRQKGNFTGGYLIYGYKVQNKKIIVDEEQAEVIKFIYEQYSVGVYVKDIISALTEKGVFNNGKPFARNTIYNILKNEKYSGIYRHKNEIFDNMYPQIVPQDVFDKVQEKTAKNKYGKRSIEVVYLLRHKLKCGYCGKPISAECGTAKNGETKRYYKCLGRKHNNGCQKSMVRKDILENYVVENIVKGLSKQKNTDKIILGLMQMQDKQQRENSSLGYLIKEKRQTENAINNIMSAIEQGVVANTTAKRLKDLELKAEDLEKKILIEKSKNAVKLTEKDMREFYMQALSLESQMLINYLIKEILLFNDRMEIQFNSPLKTSPDDNRGFSFYSETVKMPYVIQNKPKPVLKDFILTMTI